MFYNYVCLLKEGRYIEWILMDFIYIIYNIYISIVSGSIMVYNIYIYPMSIHIIYMGYKPTTINIHIQYKSYKSPYV